MHDVPVAAGAAAVCQLPLPAAAVVGGIAAAATASALRWYGFCCWGGLSPTVLQVWGWLRMILFCRSINCPAVPPPQPPRFLSRVAAAACEDGTAPAGKPVEELLPVLSLAEAAGGWRASSTRSARLRLGHIEHSMTQPRGEERQQRGQGGDSLHRVFIKSD